MKGPGVRMSPGQLSTPPAPPRPAPRRGGGLWPCPYGLRLVPISAAFPQSSPAVPGGGVWGGIDTPAPLRALSRPGAPRTPPGTGPSRRGPGHCGDTRAPLRALGPFPTRELKTGPRLGSSLSWARQKGRRYPGAEGPGNAEGPEGHWDPRNTRESGPVRRGCPPRGCAPSADGSLGHRRGRRRTHGGDPRIPFVAPWGFLSCTRHLCQGP